MTEDHKLNIHPLFNSWASDSNLHFFQTHHDTTWQLVDKLDDIVSQLNIAFDRTSNFISKTAVIVGNVFIGTNVFVGDYSLIRGPAVLLDNTVVGHATELIHSFVGPGSQVTHKATIGHTIIGSNVNIGACASVSSFIMTGSLIKNDWKKIHIKYGPKRDKFVDTGLFKFGAVIGDGARIGMNASIGPGVIIGQNTLVEPNVFLRSGIYGPNMRYSSTPPKCSSIKGKEKRSEEI